MRKFQNLKNCRSKKILDRKQIFGPKKNCRLKTNFWTRKKFQTLKKCITQKKTFGTQKHYTPNKILDRKNLDPKNFWRKHFGTGKEFISKKIYGPKRFLQQKKLWSQNIVAPKKFLGKQIYSRPKFVLFRPTFFFNQKLFLDPKFCFLSNIDSSSNSFFLSSFDVTFVWNQNLFFFTKNISWPARFLKGFYSIFYLGSIFCSG